MFLKLHHKLLFMVSIVFLLSFSTITAQNTTTPLILTFETDIASVTPDQAESGEFPMTLMWTTEGIRTSDELHLQVYVLNQWINALSSDADPLPANGSRQHIVPHTLDFAQPRLRLVIFDQAGEIISLQELIIPYENSVETVEINTFTADVVSLDETTLINRTASVPVAWDVENRPINSNIVFEQVYNDGRVINVEFSREHLWIRSSGVGAVRPALPVGDLVRLRLQVRDVTNGTVYASAELTIPVVESPVIGDPVTTPELLFFEANTASAQPADTITLSWASTNAQRAFIEVITFVPCCDGVGETEVSQVYENLPANGSLEVTAPSYGASVTYQLILDTYQPFEDRGPSATVSVNLGNDAIVTVSGAYQPFENGFMLWQGDTGTIWVLLNSGAMYSFAESAYVGLPDNPIIDTPPENRIAPVSGFGRVWGNNDNIRTSLGWGLGVEQSYNMTVERVSAIANGAVNFLINLPDGRRIVIRDSGYWGFQP